MYNNFRQGTYSLVLTQIRALIINFAFILGVYSEDNGYIKQNYLFLILMALCVIELTLTQILQKNLEKKVVKTYINKEDSVLVFGPDAKKNQLISARIEDSIPILKTEKSNASNEQDDLMNESIPSQDCEVQQATYQEYQSESKHHS